MKMADLKKMLKKGKIEIGSKGTMRSLITGKAKLVVIAANCPRARAEDIKIWAKIANIDVFEYEEGSLKLGELCGKPYPISCLAVTDLGGVSIKRGKEA